MLTVDFDRLGIGSGTKVIDVGCGAGRHAFEAYRRGADVVAFDRDESELQSVETILRAMAETGEAPATASAKVVVGDALKLPYADETFDCVIASEILEHIPQDDAAITELIRVLKVGGTLAVSVPGGCQSRCAGCSLTSTTATRAAMCAFTAPVSCATRSAAVEWN
jgi:ubiquinone/menaquinone biosynthesis C-methylase UbiE